MELQHLVVKIPVQGDLAVEPGVFIDLFHRWVSEQSMPELLVDIGDYRHVPAGPGILLVGFEAEYAIDHTDSRWGVLYRRKDVLPGTNTDRLRQAIGAAAHAGQRIERELNGQVTFSRSAIEVIVNDRLLAPNTAESLSGITPVIQAFAREVLGHDAVTIAPHDADRRRRFGVTVRSSQPFELETLAEGARRLQTDGARGL
jgi:hypothetical protein